MIYKISKDYTDMPGGRYIVNGEYSGEDFRDTILIKMITECKRNNEKLVIDLDGGFGYPPSFLEEAFGGLIRKHNIDKNWILKNIEFISHEEPYLVSKITEYIKEAKYEGRD